MLGRQGAEINQEMVFIITTVDLGWGQLGSSGVEGKRMCFMFSTMITTSVTGGLLPKECH